MKRASVNLKKRLFSRSSAMAILMQKSSSSAKRRAKKKTRQGDHS
jgi:hypothetical protein